VTLFRRLSDDFNVPQSPAHSIRYVAGIRDEVIYQTAFSILPEMTSETAAGRMYVETASLTLAARLVSVAKRRLFALGRKNLNGIGTWILL
jgi:AraC family transcriptional regulator